MSINYVFTTSTIESVQNITEKRLNIAHYDSKNLQLIEGMILNFEDASRIGERKHLKLAKNKKELILKNLQASKAIGSDKNIIQISKDFKAYFEYALTSTEEFIKNRTEDKFRIDYDIDYSSVSEFRTITAVQLTVFQNLEKDSTKQLNNAKELLNIKNHNYFIFTLILSLSRSINCLNFNVLSLQTHTTKIS